MRRSPFWPVVWVTVVGELILLVGNVAASFVTDWTGIASWLAVPAVGIVAAVVVAVFGKYTEDRAGARPPPGPVQPGRRPPTYRTSRVLPVLGVLLTLVIVAGGVTLGVRYAVGLLTGNESGVAVLVQEEVTGGGAGVSLTVQEVEYTPNFTRVRLLAQNDNRVSASLPVFGFCILVGEDGTTLEADPFRSDWSETMAPGGRLLGTLVFPGRLPAGVSSASLSFTTVFVSGPGSGAATVEGIELNPAP